MNATHLIAAAIGLAAAGWSAAQSPAPAGRWLTESGNLEVDIAACGQSLCGTVVKVIANRSMSGPAAAAMAPPPANARPLLGLGILQDFAPAADGQWQGRIYNRERDASYDCLMGLAGPDLLQVNIVVSPALPPKVQFWRRVGAPAAP
ncbi:MULTISPECIES: DUF2147 domain-containing protein [unclassified Janthinobacterium]|uniref:DUF2147 domain-containing protein n=1 Tax=unclassified Janthinobacterium TaxID=2610881 RepID=UPI00034A6553|nr:MULTISPECIES: DUF2147 domain-containing protein [unclassified Janthinobacterium]MEC5160959.1 uncharacterized protein (DUF2147 family) [Janthinobacterium sp. CG_S6]